MMKSIACAPIDVDTQRTLNEVEFRSICCPRTNSRPTKMPSNFSAASGASSLKFAATLNTFYQQVSKGTFPAGIEYWQPLFFSQPLTTAVQLSAG
jgi:transcription-repair coupling factor (superfamily II helicase)